MKTMNLERFIPNRLKVHLFAWQINAILRIFLKSRKLFPKRRHEKITISCVKSDTVVKLRKILN